MITTAAAPSLSGQQLPAVIRPSGRKTGLSPATASSVTPGRGPSSVDTTVPSGRVTGVISRAQKPSAIAFSARFWRPDAELVHLLAGDVVDLRQVLRGLAHGQVDVGQLAVLARVGPGRRAARGALLGAGLGVGEERVLPAAADQRLRLRRQAVGAAPGVAGHGLDAGRDEHVALAGLDRVERHPGGLQRRRAVPGQRRAGQVVVAEQGGDHAGHVEALLAAGQAAAQVEVVDVARVELRHLVQGGPDDRGGEVVGAQLAQGALGGAADRGAGGGDDDGFGGFTIRVTLPLSNHTEQQV